jgi:predicted RND superfamily exporter protein
MSEETEIKTTKNWSASIMITIVLQTLGFVWYAAQLDQQVKQHTAQIAELKSDTGVLISREQLNDLLGGRDQKITNIESALIRIEKKIDGIK